MSVSSAGTSLLSSMPSARSLLSAFTTIAAYQMLFRTVLSHIQSTLNQIVPQIIQEKVLSKISSLFGNSASSSRITLVFEQYDEGQPRGVVNEMYELCEIFLSLKIPPSVEMLKAFQEEGEKISITVAEGERAMDVFEGVEVEWEVVSPEEGEGEQVRSINLSFPKENKETILGSYLPYVERTATAFTQENCVLHLFSNCGGMWVPSLILNHPSTFETLAIDSKLKQDLIKDLDRFVKRKDYYRRAGRAWKRGYLLYGPPGTGKSSLVAAMANHLKFNIYDLELTSVFANRHLRSLLVSTKNRSIIVIEDIDCSSQLQENQVGKLTLSGLLNFIDGLWSSCGNERIIVVTTNHKDRLDPALLRPGRMDMHIHMFYCTPCGFKALGSNYLGVRNHSLFAEIERLITQVQVTPAQVAEELLKGGEADTALEGLVVFLERLKAAQNEEEEIKKQTTREMSQPLTMKKRTLISR